MKFLALLIAGSLTMAAPAAAADLITLPADTYVSFSPLEGWTVQLTAPLLYGQGGAWPSVGVSVSRHFAIGGPLADSWGEWARRLGVGVGASVFAPLHFQQLYLGANVGLGHSTSLGEHFIDYGLSYAPLVQIDWAGNAANGYNGLLANVGLHLKMGPTSWSTFGLQGGFYIPFTGPAREPIWVLQPLVGLNLGF